MRHRSTLTRLVVEKQVTAINVQACLDYLQKVGDRELDVEAFKTACGVGRFLCGSFIQAYIAT